MEIRDPDSSSSHLERLDQNLSHAYSPIADIQADSFVLDRHASTDQIFNNELGNAFIGDVECFTLIKDEKRSKNSQELVYY